LILLFVGLELVSIPTYVLLYVGRHDAQGQEAASKYFFLSILSSAVLLYGFSFLYGMAGSTRLETIAEVLSKSTEATPLVGTLAPLALLLVVGGLAFRLAAVPFHFYAPDVYQGTSHANAAVLSTLPKIAGLVVLARILVAALPTADMAELGWKTMLVLSILTMTLGNVLALWQTNIRRLLAYSSIAHTGYMLIGVSVALAAQLNQSTLAPDAAATTFDGLGASLFYLTVYMFATLGAFAALAFLSPGSTHQIDTLDDLAGLNRRHPFVAIALAVFMFSLTGLPPLAGFWGKFNLLFSALTLDVATPPGAAALRPWFVGLAVVTVLNAAIGAAYYLRVVGSMYFRAPHEKPLPITRHAGPGMAIAACAAVVIGIGLLPTRTLGIMDRAAASLEHNSILPGPREAQVLPREENVVAAVPSC
jgi:NADH-quinone oxidoreductase subunit N